MSIATAIFETFAEHEKEKFLSLLKKKALQLQKIEAELEGDIFSKPEPEIKKLHQRQQIITDELNVLYGFYEAFNSLHGAYLNEMIAMSDELSQMATQIKLSNINRSADSALINLMAA